MTEGTDMNQNCRGSWALGTACGKCPRCEATRPAIAALRPQEAVMQNADLLRAMSQAEDVLAKRIAERAIGCTDEKEKRFLRGLWQFCSARAGYFMEMAHDASN